MFYVYIKIRLVVHRAVTYRPKMDHKIYNANHINSLELQTVELIVTTHVAGYLQLDRTATQNIA